MSNGVFVIGLWDSLCVIGYQHKREDRQCS